MWTGDGRVFFYNPSQRLSLWETPKEFEGRSDVEKLITIPPQLDDNGKVIRGPGDTPVPGQPVVAAAGSTAPVQTTMPQSEKPQEEKKKPSYAAASSPSSDGSSVLF